MLSVIGGVVRDPNCVGQEAIASGCLRRILSSVSRKTCRSMSIDQGHFFDTAILPAKVRSTVDEIMAISSKDPYLR